MDEQGRDEPLVDLHHGVLGILPVAEVAEAHAEDEVRVALEEGAEVDRVARGPVTLDQLDV